MTTQGMVIGLGGIGSMVVQRIKNMLAVSPSNLRSPALRLLAFDILRPTMTTGRMGPIYPFLVRLAPAEIGMPTTRQMARQILINDIKKGPDSSAAQREISAQIAALHSSGATGVEVFIVTSSFGLTGTAWLLDIAHLCRQLDKGDIICAIHAVLITPETWKTIINLPPIHQQIHFTLLKELEGFYTKRDWSEGISLYAGTQPGGIAGGLVSPPFATIQVLDGQNMGGAPELSAIPAAAEGILCQLDDQAGPILRHNLAARQAAGDLSVFSTFGVRTLTRPSRLLTEAGVQRSLLGLVDNLLPLRTHPATGRPEGLEPARILVPSDPYGDVERWLGEYPPSGVIDEIMHQAGLTSITRQDWVNTLAKRETPAWKRAFFNVAGGEKWLQEKNLPSSIQPWVQAHFQAYLNVLGDRALRLHGSPIGVFEYLSRLEICQNNYLTDLSKAEDTLKQAGEHSSAEPLRQRLELARLDLEQKRASNLSRLFPKRVEEAQLRYDLIKRIQDNFKERETLLDGMRQASIFMLALTRKILELYRYLSQTLALDNRSLYNTALDRFKSADRELQIERSLRCQQVVVDKVYEDRQLQVILNRLLEDVFTGLKNQIQSFQSPISGQEDLWRLSAPVLDPAAPGTPIDLADLRRTPEETAALLLGPLKARLTVEISAALCSGTINNFANYIHTNPVKLASEVVYLSEPLAKMLVQPTLQTVCLFMPDPEAAKGLKNIQAMVYEIYEQVGELYQLDNADPDHITLFRRFDGLALGHLLTSHHSALDPHTEYNEDQIKVCKLWNLTSNL